MKSGSSLLKKTFQGLLFVGTLSSLSGVVCMVIDSMITGRFLGTTAFTASGLFTPVNLLCNLVLSLLGLGVGVICTRYMGMAKPERVNQVFSVVIIALLAAGSLITIGLFAGAPVIAGVLGGRTGNPGIVAAIRDYLRGYAFGLIPMFLNITLMNLMMMDNDRNRSLFAMGTTLIVDISLDLLNVLVFHKGMLGMALASSLSFIAGTIVMLGHFTKKDRILHFTMAGLKLGDLLEVIALGITSAINSGSQALKVLVYNSLLLTIAGAGAVAAFTVCTNTATIMIAAIVGIMSSTANLCSLLYGEKDRRGLIEGLGLSLRTTVIFFTVLAGLIILFAKPLAGFFLPSDAEYELHLAVIFIRLMAVQLWFMSPSFSLGGAYQGICRLKLNYLFAALREGVFPILTVWILGRVYGMTGFAAGVVLAGVLVLACTVLIPALINRRFSLEVEDILLLPKDFGAGSEDTYEISMYTLNDVMIASREIMDFAKRKGGDKRTAFMMSLFVEEMAKNTIQYGFREEAEASVDLRMVYSDQGKVIRLRDNGKPFDPVAWLRKNSDEDPSSGVGIRMVTALAKDVRYIPAMQLNNLTIVL